METKKITILVVEDETPLLKAIGDKLKRSEFQVVTARTSDEAISALEDKKEIEVIWLDHYLLGKEDGLTFLARLKNSPEWKKIPVFVVSNTASDDKVQSYMRLGADKFYTKADSRLDQIIGDIKDYLKEKKGS